MCPAHSSFYSALLAIATMPVLTLTTASAESVTLKHAMSADASRGDQLIDNGGFEVVEDGQCPGWQPWDLGYEADDSVTHSGDFSARCSNETTEQHRGLTYVIQLNQTEPIPIVAECWSKAENVSGAPGGDYSLYLDLEYMDGTPLWGQIDPCPVGTHDWQRQTVTVIPEKPIREVSVHGIFRRRTGTVWFDDFKCWELSSQAGVTLFDGFPVTPERTLPERSSTAALDIPIPALCLRDVAANSELVGPAAIRFEGELDGSQTHNWTDAGLQLSLQWRCTKIGDALRIDGIVEDLTGEDRAVSVYCIVPVEAHGWQWHDDQRAHRTIEDQGTYSSYTAVRAGANGMASKYPLACIGGDNEALALATPLDMPRLCRLAYDAHFRELYGAVDLGLSAETQKHPSQATFSFILYPCDPDWGFRSALRRYYDLFEHCFTKRNEKEGIWMPFTDIATVQGFDDFGFQFQEGAPNPAFDEKHGIYSFVYVEPVSNWVQMPQDMERTNQRAIDYVHERARAGDPQAMATLTSAIHSPAGAWHGGIAKAPWCDGALYTLNPSPNVPTGPEAINQFQHNWNGIESAFDRARMQKGAWKHFGRGYQIAENAGRNGSRAIRASREEGGPAAGASQTVAINQQQPAPIIASVWTKADAVSGESDNDYSLYIDLVYGDGEPGFGFVVPAQTGTHGWQKLQQTIDEPKAVQSLTYHLLLRGNHTGTAWFDDAYLGIQGQDENLLKQGGFEPSAATGPAPELDGTYIDSFEMASRALNYRRDHFREADIPLIFDSESRVCQLEVFNTIEFLREVAARMHGRGKMMFANATPISFPWPAAHLDVMGIETNWKRGDEYAPNPDSTMNYRRALCYQRPYLLLLNTVYAEFKPEWVEMYFKRCTAYGIFPSFFSRNAADDPYWTRPNLYNRDRPLFKRYIPVICSLNAAGWQPITHARTDNDAVYVERFGQPAGPLYLTLFNDSDRLQTAQVSVGVEQLGLDANASVKEVLTGEVRQLNEGRLTTELKAQDVNVLKLAD